MKTKDEYYRRPPALPTGRTINIGQISMIRIADDQISEIREEADRLGLMQQLGAIPAPAGKES